MEQAEDIARAFPPEAGHLLLVLFLSFLIGLEREGHQIAGPKQRFGGVRTFPLIGLTGYALALLSGTGIWPLTLGLVVVGGLVAISFQHKLVCADRDGNAAGVTSEMSALLVYVVGGLVERGYLWIACTLVIAALLLLELKDALERLSHRLPNEEVLTLAKFLVLSVVILPIVPNQNFTNFQINPYKTWLVVVAVAAISYGSYVLQQLLKGAGGVLLTAVLGGAYSSTVTTVTLAKKAVAADRPHLFAGGILIASGVTYFRLAALLALFNVGLLHALAPAFCALGVVGVGGGWLWAQRADPSTQAVEQAPAKNPLELSAAFFFALVFLAMMVITHLALTYLGKGGVFSLAAIMGVTDVTPFVLSVTQSAGEATPLSMAAGSIAIAAASNNAVKGFYAKSFADARTGTQSLLLLLGLAAFGLAPLIWLH